MGTVSSCLVGSFVDSNRNMNTRVHADRRNNQSLRFEAANSVKIANAVGSRKKKKDRIKGATAHLSTNEKKDAKFTDLKNENGKNNIESKHKNEKEAGRDEIHIDDTLVGIIGLNNLGNTCFLNAALQCALQSPEFIEYFLHLKFDNNSYNVSLSIAWSKFVQNAYCGQLSQYSTTILRQLRSSLTQLSPCIGSGNQEDSFHALSTLLNGLDKETCVTEPAIFEMRFDTSKTSPYDQNGFVEYIVNKKVWEQHICCDDSKNNELQNGQSIIRKLFDGVECEKLTCVECGFKQLTFQTYRNIGLPLIYPQSKNVNQESKVPETVEECLQIYQDKDASNQFALDCDECDDDRVVEREVDILKTPQILTLHIDRDIDNTAPLRSPNSYSNKTQHLFKYEMELKLKDDVYDLFAVDIHHGTTEKWGHYTAMVKSLMNGKWYRMDDNSKPKEIVNKSNLVSNNAMFLMYNKRTT